MRRILLFVAYLAVIAGIVFAALTFNVRREEPAPMDGPTAGAPADQPKSAEAPPPEAQDPTDGLGRGAPSPSSAGGEAPPPPPVTPEPEEKERAKKKDSDDYATSKPPAAPPAQAPPTSGAPAGGTAPEDAWDVVPVYYGTDRARDDANTERLDYSSLRGRRLELGLAHVTVPKAHKVPQIERPWALQVPFTKITIYQEAEDPKTHFTMKEIKSLSEAELIALVKERLAASQRFKDHALVFIHGYNTSFDFAIYRTAQVAYDLKFDGAAFAYSWPSGGGVASYTYDRESSGQAEPYLKEFLKLVVAKSGAKSVSIIAHSMGNQPTLQVLRDLKRDSDAAGVKISQIILAAPDVDRDNFENIAKEIQGLASGVTLYAAANDRALRVSRNFYGGVPRAGDVPDGGPLVIDGVDTIDVTDASMDSLGLNHSGYAENNALLEDIARLIETGVRPPNARTPSLKAMPTSSGTYWRYLKAP